MVDGPAFRSTMPDMAAATTTQDAGPRRGALAADALLGAVLDRTSLTAADVPRLLGADRHRLSVLRIEQCVQAHALLTDRELLTVKAQLSGFEVPDGDVAPTTELGVDNARKVAGITLARPDGSSQVALVDPDPVRIRAVADVLGVDPARLDVRVTTVRQLLIWVDAVDVYRTADPDFPVEVSSSQTLPDIWTLLDELVRTEGSDLHLQVGEPPVIRTDGDLRRLPYEPVHRSWIDRAVDTMTGRELAVTLDGPVVVNEALRFGTRRLRLVITRSRTGPTVVARLLSDVVPVPEQLGLPPVVRSWVDLRSGLVLVTGMTGSGKSTTLAALVSRIATRHRRKIVTLEDPVEFHLPGGQSLVDQRQLGSDFPDFPTAISTVLRQDPDVILVGEMRDAATIRAAVEAADTGHLVLSTLHTADAASSVARIIDFFPADQQPSIRSKVAYVLRGIVSQTLLRKQAGVGRVAAFEVMVNTPAIRNLLESPEQLKQIGGYLETARRDGMQTMDQSLVQLVRSRAVDQATAYANASDPERFLTLLDS